MATNAMVKGECYLVARQNPRKPWELLFEVRKGKPGTIRGGGIPIKLNVSLPGALFTRPQLCAKVEIDPARVTPQQVDATVVNNIQETIKAQTGMDLKIEVVQP